jgi:nickel transport protein
MRHILCALCLLLACTGPALAHKLKLFVTSEGGQVTGSLYFAGGGKAGQLDGHVLDAAGQVVARLRTGDDGAFSFTPPDGAAYRIRFETADGHMAEAAIGAAAQTPVAAAVTGSAADLDAALARQLHPLREQIDALENRIRLSDIIGGLGFIFGLFGCYAWIAARRKEPT